MIDQFLRWLTAFSIIAASSVLAEPVHHEALIKDHDRIVFIGDSITGQGAKGGKGAWIAMIGEGLNLLRPQAQPTLIGLGGSGSTVGAWLGFEKRSRTEALALDVKETDVGKTLDGGAEIVVVMLGMNDVLSPSVRDSTADLDAWMVRYRELLEAICARSHPRVIGLATVTPCTEDPNSPKNKVVSELNKRVRILAQEKRYLVLPANEASYEVQSAGRKFDPQFRITGDYVHPNRAGHLAIAVGMLRGLGEEKAGDQLLLQHADLYQPVPFKSPALSYTLKRMPGLAGDDEQHFVIQYGWTAPGSPTVPTVRASVPEEWKVNVESVHAATGQFELAGPLDHLENKIKLTATSDGETLERIVTVPAGWRIAVGGSKGLGWVQNTKYDPEKDRQPLDLSLANGQGLMAPVIFAVGEPRPWDLYIANSDFTGRGLAGSVDLAAVTFFNRNQQAYGARWIYSERNRAVSLNLGTECFAGTYSLGVWLNGRSAYEGKLMGEPGRKIEASTALEKGWNLLVFKSTFIAWQWQFSIDLRGGDGDDLADLRYATKAPTARAEPAN